MFMLMFYDTLALSMFKLYLSLFMLMFCDTLALSMSMLVYRDDLGADEGDLPMCHLQHDGGDPGDVP